MKSDIFALLRSLATAVSMSRLRTIPTILSIVSEYTGILEKFKFGFP